MATPQEICKACFDHLIECYEEAEAKYYRENPLPQSVLDVVDDFIERSRREDRRRRRLFDPMYDRPPLNRAERRAQ